MEAIENSIAWNIIGYSDQYQLRIGRLQGLLQGLLLQNSVLQSWYLRLVLQVEYWRYLSWYKFKISQYQQQSRSRDLLRVKPVPCLHLALIQPLLSTLLPAASRVLYTTNVLPYRTFTRSTKKRPLEARQIHNHTHSILCFSEFSLLPATA